LTESARILLVDDDPRAAQLIGEMLRANSWTERLVLAHTKSLDEAIEDLLASSAACVLVTLTLPGVQPLAAIDQIRSAAPDVPILSLADSVQETDALQAIRAGSQDVLVMRELSPTRLRKAVRYAIDRQHSEAELAHRALQDPLTSLPNRTLFLDRLRVALERGRRTNTPLAVLLLDVDSFKDLNQSRGRSAGDAVLAELGRRLQRSLRPTDTVARCGEDEFTLVLEQLPSEREVILIAERIADAAARPISLEAGETSVSVSVGVAMVHDPTTPPDVVMGEAYAAVDRAKAHGGSRFELFDEASQVPAVERLRLEAELARAIERSELRVHYQPTMSLNGTVGVTGLEALVRWQHPDRGLIPAAEFIPLAEETGAVLRIGEFVLGEVLGQISAWRRLVPNLTVAVNLSPGQLAEGDLVTSLAGQMRSLGVDPEALCVEITESALAQDPEAARQAVVGLKAAGVRVAIDHYGIGAASLSELQRLPVDTLKMHESFIADLGTDFERGSLVGAVVDLGHALGLEVDAEGVETDNQLAELRSLGFDGAQGFLLGRPVPGEGVEALLAPA
jgi:diguanylate cyclase (GGDEF)-like protein